MILKNKNELGQKKQRGVVLVFFLMIFAVLLAFLMVIGNTGLIIYQKIRLQSAVDLAAYAGASVQASYLGNQSSGADSIQNLNFEVFKRYQNLIKDLQKVKATAWPNMIGIPGPAGLAACVAMCNAANYATSKQVEMIYKSAAKDMEGLRNRMVKILEELPKASREAAEATLRLNIPELAVSGSDAASSYFGDTTNDVNQVVSAGKNSSPLSKKKNAVLGFSSEKGLYLASVVAPVPHTFVYFGLVGAGCFPWLQSDASANYQPNYWYCAVNGTGYPGGQKGYNGAALAYARSFVPDSAYSGNVGTIATISDSKRAAIRLQFIQNHNRPDPFFVSAAEWYPKDGMFMNLENSMGKYGNLFPKQTRLVAVSAAEPFGGSLALNDGRPYGTRLQSIRKLLLDPRMLPVRSDFPGLFEYMESLAPVDNTGRPSEKADDVIRRFLH